MISNPLVPVIKPFPSKLKKAMYTAAKKVTISRGTWNGCAFNEAAKEETGLNLSGVQVMGRIFNVDPSYVHSFIDIWDTLVGSDKACNKLLIEALLEVGLHTEPDNYIPKKEKKGGIVSISEETVIYESKMKELDEEFKDLVASVDINELPEETQKEVSTVYQLLNS